MRRFSRVVAHLVVTTLTATVAGCGALRGNDIAGKTIRYQVEYSGSPQDALSNRALVIEYTTTEGHQEQTSIVLPWTKVAGVAGRGFKPSVKAQFDGFGTIACRIVADDSVIAERTSPEEPYPVIECAA